MSHSLMAPKLVLYVSVWQLVGWKLAEVMTSVRSAKLSGLMLMMLKVSEPHSMSHKFTLSASVEMNVWPSLFWEMESIWQVPCAFLNSRRHVAVMTLELLPGAGSTPEGPPAPAATGSRTAFGRIFQNFIVVSGNAGSKIDSDLSRQWMHA